MVEGVDLGQAGALGHGLISVESMCGPHDRRHVEAQLHQRIDQRGYVAETGGDNAKEHSHPYAVQQEEEQSGEEEESIPSQGGAEDDQHDDVNDHVVGQEKRLPPHQPVDVHTEWGGQLFNEALVGDEHLGAVLDTPGDEAPQDEAEGDVGEEVGEFLLVEQPEGERHHAGGDGDPEGAEGRAAVALLDVLPAQLEPQLVGFPAVHEVVEGALEREGVRLGRFAFKGFRENTEAGVVVIGDHTSSSFYFVHSLSLPSW